MAAQQPPAIINIMNLTTAARIKNLLGNFTGSTLDLVLNQIIAGVSMQIENSPLFDRSIKCEARSEIFDTDNGQQIFSLKGYPISASPAAQIWFDTARAFTNTALATNLYAIDNARGKVKIDGYGMIKAKQCLKISYTGG